VTIFNKKAFLDSGSVYTTFTVIFLPKILREELPTPILLGAPNLISVSTPPPTSRPDQ
jgi:hypothetical protein